MAKNATFAVRFRRRRQGRTNYKRRFGLLKSGKPRLVVRITNTQIIVQFVKYHKKGDKVLLTKSSNHLKNYGWTHSSKNIPAAYLTGLMAGKESPVKKAILDSGISHPNSRVFAVLKGVVDAGVNVARAPEVAPPEERITGAHIDKSVPKLFAAVKKRIMSGTEEKRIKKAKPIKKKVAEKK